MNPVDSSGGHSAAWIRRSLHLLKSSLSSPMSFPHIDDDGDEEMEIDEEAVENLCIQVEKQSAATADSILTDLSKAELKSDAKLMDSELRSSSNPQHCTSRGECTKEQDSEDTDVKMEEGISEQDEAMIVDCDESVGGKPEPSDVNFLDCNNVPQENDQQTDKLGNNSLRLSAQDNKSLCSSASKLLNEELETKTVQDNCYDCPQSEPDSEEPHLPVEEQCNESPNRSMNCVSPSLTIATHDVSSMLKSPTPSISPKTNSSRKSLRTSSMLSASQKDPIDRKLILEAVRNSLAKSLKGHSSNAMSTQTSKSFLAPTEHLAASIRHGLEIIDNHRQSSAFRRSSFRF